MNDMNLYQVLEQFSTTDTAIAFLRKNGILAKDAPHCGIVGCVQMTEIRRTDQYDGVVWLCPKHKGRKKSVRSGSFLENQNIRLEIFLLIAHFWGYSTPVGRVQHWAKVSNKTAIMWYQFLRSICSVWLIDNPIKLGGPGTVVQVDEFLTIKEKCEEGHVISRWVFGIYDCHKNLGYLEFVNVRNRDSILPIILEHVLPGTEIHTDYWSTYLALPAVPVIPPYKHLRVTRAADFVHPVTGEHNNSVKSFWNNFMKNKQKSDTSEVRLQSHLDEFLWRQLYGKKTIEAFQNILHQISVLNPL